MALVPYQAEFDLELVRLWRQSFQRAMGLEEHNRSTELLAQLDYFRTIDAEHIHVAMDTDSGALTGFMVLTPGELEHLYVHVNSQGQGLGRLFLENAKLLSPEGLLLYTFRKNHRARAFYESNGFLEVGRGYAEFHNNPWASTQEELADIRYRWLP